MWLDTSLDGTYIQMDLATIDSARLQIVGQVVRAAETMGIHMNLEVSNPAVCLCDNWDSSVASFNEEAQALGAAVLEALNGYATATLDTAMRAQQLAADQQQLTAGPALGSGTDANFGALMAQAIVNDANNRAIGTWLDSTPGTSQVDILLAMQGQSGGGTFSGGGDIGLTLNQMTIDAQNDAAKVWLAPDGLSYSGQDDSGRDTYTNRLGETKTNSEIYRDNHDDNHNGSTDDYV